MKHTSTPWIAVNEHFGTIGKDKPIGTLIGSTFGLTNEDAEFIVRAVNSREALLEAAQEAAAEFEGAVYTHQVALRKKLLKAIAQAEKYL